MSRQTSNTKGPSQRQLRVGEQIKHIIAETLQRGDLMEDLPLLTVTEVRPSPDMRQATAYVVSMNDETVTPALEALNANSRLFQKELGRQMSMKFTPRIHFKVDDSFENAQRINALLGSLNTKDTE